MRSRSRFGQLRRRLSPRRPLTTLTAAAWARTALSVKRRVTAIARRTPISLRLSSTESINVSNNASADRWMPSDGVIGEPGDRR